jgi:co-chaperonin GroES (HSP10)
MKQAIMDRVFVTPDEVKQAIIIEEKRPKYKSGIVKSIGEQVTSVKVGDHIIFEPWEIETVDGLVAIRENWILGVITDE